MPKFLLLFLPVLALAQLTPNSVTVTASHYQNIPADQISFSVTIYAPLDSTRDDVLSIAQGVGLTLSDFSAVSYVPPDQSSTGTSSSTGVSSSLGNTDPLLAWSFNLVTPVANMKSTTTGLTALQNTVAGRKNGTIMIFYVSGMTLSPQAQQSPTCSTPSLLTDARAQAAKLAAAAGMNVGAVQSIANVNPAAPYFIGSYCSITVKFALEGF